MISAIAFRILKRIERAIGEPPIDVRVARRMWNAHYQGLFVSVLVLPARELMGVVDEGRQVLAGLTLEIGVGVPGWAILSLTPLQRLACVRVWAQARSDAREIAQRRAAWAQGWRPGLRDWGKLEEMTPR